MKTHQTNAGTAIVEMTKGEYAGFLDREVQRSVGSTAAEFRARVEAGEVEWDDPDVYYIAGLLGLGRNGHR